MELLENEFYSYVARQYDGYTAMDTKYSVLSDEPGYISIRFFTTVNLGGSGEVTRSFTLDKTSGKVISLEDLFEPESEYVKVISDEILRQMEEQVEAGTGDYFIPGGIWDESECFKEISPEQDFYILDGQLIITFKEYEVAPGSMGMPEFAIPYEAIEEIVLQDSILSSGA